MLAAALAVAAEPADDTPAGQLFALVNQERAERGLSPLTWSDELAALATAHSSDMLEHGWLGHQRAGGPSLVERAHAAEVAYDRIAENVGFASSVERVHQTLMKSPGHRRNLLDPGFEQIGIGVLPVPEGSGYRPDGVKELDYGGYLVVTQVFRE